MKNIKKFFSFISIFLLIPFAIVLFYHLIYTYLNEQIFGIFPQNIWISILIIDVLYLTILGITGKSKITFPIILVILLIIFSINQIKIAYMGEPLFFSDFNFINQTSNLANIVKDSFYEKIKSYIPMFLISLIATIGISISQAFIVLEIKSIKKRIICSLAGGLILILLFFPFSWCKELYQKYFFGVDEYKDYSSYTNYVKFYSYHGFIAGMYYQLLDSRFEEPQNYNDESLNKLLKEASSNNQTEKIGTPNIIIVLSESFFDVSLLKENIVFNKEITSNFNRLKEEGYLINIISPSYGGMTANVTYELLTGGNMSYFRKGYIPFMQLYKEDKKYISIINDLKDNGYNTKILMGNDSYNSETTLKNLGFNEYIKIKKTRGNQKGYYVSDDYIADMITSNLTKNKTKTLIMAETMQSHMSYEIAKYSKYNIKILNSNLKSDYQDVLLSYAQGIYDADKMLNKLYEYIKTLEEETILIFFGDHLPYLETQIGENVIEQLDYFNTENELINTYRLYNTQGLILSNYNLKLDLEKETYLGFDLLLTNIINQMDINVSPYYKWLYKTKNDLPSYNQHVTVDNIGNVYSSNELPEKMKKIKELRNHMMYKQFIK